MANVNCEACNARISEEAFRCPACGVDRPGVPQPARAPQAARAEKPLGPAALLFLAILVAVVTGGLGGLVIISGDETSGAGWLVLIVGGTVASLMATVATVAMGVAMGVRVAKDRGHL